MTVIRKPGLVLCVALGLGALFAGCTAARRPAALAELPVGKKDFWPTSTCRGCHDRIVAEHLESSHEMSFSNPVFQAQYRQDLLSRAEKDPALLKEAQQCISCHEPILYVTKGPSVVSPADADPEMNGVTCDVCHTITGYSGPRPQNGNYMIVPGEIKLGPLQSRSDWHRAYSELHTRSEICAVCHEATNHHGFQIKATFTEWRESDFARRGIQCQDCHMNVDGFLTEGKPRFSSGKAARMSPGSAPERERLFTHQFPGAHSKTQVEGAIALMIETKATETEGMIAIEITVDNARTGHSMPSGSADLRLLWLEVTARAGDRWLHLPAEAAGPEVPDGMNLYSLAGHGIFDAGLLGPEIPKGSRVYRAVFADTGGQATLDSYSAIKKLFDNRLKAAEKRREFYRLMLTEEMKGDLLIEATLKYLPYSSTFANRFGLPEPEPVIVSRQDMIYRTPTP
jgi:hypothetical protein